MSFDTLDVLSGNVFQVTWDLGRRCNYDCSYCPVHRHDNFSPHASLDDLKKSTKFLFEYVDTYMEKRTMKSVNISFTGGEPTVNPNFINFVKYLKQEYNKNYKDKWECNFALTSNGAMSAKIAQAVIDNLEHITVSYHAESDDKLKKQVRDRIKQFANESLKSNFSLMVNVMFHAAYFDECKELCDLLHQNNIQYVPRVIGEEPESRSTFAHDYTDEQLDYMKNYWKYKNASLNDEREVANKLSAAGEPTNESKKAGWAIGRPCCGNREMCLSAKQQDRTAKFVDFRNFKGWNCSVNWFFLHLEQQTDSVYHHQTCQARFDQTRGAIGKISEGHKIIEDLRKKLESRTMPTVVCPKQTCGCGLCAPKSVHLDNYKKVISRHVDMSVFENADFQKPNTVPINPLDVINVDS